MPRIFWPGEVSSFQMSDVKSPEMNLDILFGKTVVTGVLVKYRYKTVEEGDFLYLLKRRNYSILPADCGSEYCPRPLPYCYWEYNKKRNAPECGGKVGFNRWRFWKELRLKENKTATGIYHGCLPGSSVTGCPFGLNQKVYSVHTRGIIKLPPLWGCVHVALMSQLSPSALNTDTANQSQRSSLPYQDLASKSFPP